MRKSQTRKIDAVIREFLNESHLDQKLKEVQLVAEWEDLMGKMVAARTKQIYIRNKTLFVQVSSPVLKNELIMMRNDIVEKLNELAGERLIEQLVIR